MGFAKTAIGGVASISVAIFAAILPARESTGALLPLIMVGDVFAVTAYRRHADWGTLFRLFPSVGIGVAVGAAFVAQVDDTVMKRTIGVVLLALVLVHLLLRAQGGVEYVNPRSRGWRFHMVTWGYGLLAGFTTMVANSGGPAMSLYLLSAGLTVLGFLGTGAWFFLIVNAFKLPFSVGLGLISVSSLATDLVLVPALIVGALVGRWCAERIDQARFENLVLAFTVLSSLNLLR